MQYDVLLHFQQLQESLLNGQLLHLYCCHMSTLQSLLINTREQLFLTECKTYMVVLGAICVMQAPRAASHIFTRAANEQLDCRIQ